MTVLDRHPSGERQPEIVDSNLTRALFEEARQRRRRRRLIVGYTFAAVLPIVVVIVVVIRSTGTMSSPRQTMPSEAVLGCVAGIEPVHAGEPQDVMAWAEGRPAIGEGSLWTIRSALSVHGVEYGTGWHVKFPWYTRPNGLPQVHGLRLDGPGRFTYDVNRAYDARGAFNTSTLNFSAPGCWRVTARFGTSTLRFNLRIGSR
jgi:hypothetical protein